MILCSSGCCHDDSSCHVEKSSPTLGRCTVGGARLACFATHEACTADGTSAESLTSNSVVKERLDMRTLCLCRWRLEKTPVCDYAELELLYSLLAACRCTDHGAPCGQGFCCTTFSAVRWSLENPSISPHAPECVECGDMSGCGRHGRRTA